MSAEQTVRDFMSTFDAGDIDGAASYLADNMTLRADNPPISGGKNEFVGQGTLIKEAVPDFMWNPQQMDTNGNTVTAYVQWTGTHAGTFRLSAFMPGAPDVPATGAAVSVPDTVHFTMNNGLITDVYFDSQPGEGLGVFLHQIGVELPG